MEDVANKLLKAAIAARQHAYVPYSNFAVGAALLLDSGTIISGCNVENASYSLTNCAERTAFFKAVSEGEKRFRALAVVADTDGPVQPCGACRQVMVELCPPDLPVYLSNLRGETMETTVSELLPNAFSNSSMSDKSH